MSARARCARATAPRRLPAPLVWTFDGPFERCLADIEDTLRRAIVLVGDVSRIALLIDLSLPALKQRVAAGDALQPAWGRFLERIARPTACRPRRACATCARAARSRRSSSPIGAEREPWKPVMSMKSWVLHRVQGIGAVAGRADLPRTRAAAAASRARPRADTRGEPSGLAEPALADVEHLGAYAPLIGAIRDELEHFVASQVRLHLAIAERDRFTLTSIGVELAEEARARELLQQFMQRVQARAGQALSRARGHRRAAERGGDRPVAVRRPVRRSTARDAPKSDGEYGELLEALRTTPVGASRGRSR